MKKEIEELINAGRAMIDGKGWHEIDGRCSICLRFIEAVKAAEQSAQVVSGCQHVNIIYRDYDCQCLNCGKINPHRHKPTM